MITKKLLKDKKHQSKRSNFFSFQGNRFTKDARDYHNELKHLTVDLININQRIQYSAVLCHQQIDFLKKGQKHLVTRQRPPCFDDALYHLENFSFRINGYRDKLVQFINQALRIGFDERAMGMFRIMENNGNIKEAHLDTELKKFNKDKDFKEVLSERVRMSHHRYYKIETGYDVLMQPYKQATNISEKLKFWKQNIQAKVNRADRIVLKVMEMNDRVMGKINVYLKKHPMSNSPRLLKLNDS